MHPTTDVQSKIRRTLKMNYTSATTFEQQNLFAPSQAKPATTQRYLYIPSSMETFTNTETEVRTACSGREIMLLKGELDILPTDRICPRCRTKLHINDGARQSLRHLPIGSSLMCVEFIRRQMFCPNCGHTHMQAIPFKAEHHRITRALESYTRDLLSTGNYTNKEVAELTGLGPNTVKAIDKQRLLERYTENGKLRKPEIQATFLGIDEFKLHNRHKYATHIIDMSTGRILWIAEGKKKKVVFNEMVVAEARQDEQLRLVKEGRPEEAKALKKCGRILSMSRKTIEKMDQRAAEGKAVHKGSALFGIPEYSYKGGWKERYEALLRENDLLTTVDIVKCKLSEAFEIGSEEESMSYARRLQHGEVEPMTADERMKRYLDEIVAICASADKWYFRIFKRLLENHMAGILTHTAYRLSSGKIEGINNKIKTLRRQGYGYPDDEYFFLKLIDMSRYDKRKKLASHRICN